MDALARILLNHEHPLRDKVRQEVERVPERRAVPKEPTVLDGLQRTLRQLLLDFIPDSPAATDSVYIEVNAFTPWKRYGNALRDSIDRSGVVFLHTEVDEQNRPCLLVIGTTTGKTIVCHLPPGSSETCWDDFARTFPQLAATLDHGQLIKVTTTFEATNRLLDSESVKYQHELVDVAWLAETVLPDLEPMKDDCEQFSAEQSMIMALIWSVLGTYEGPVTPELWKAAYGCSKVYPMDRDSSTMAGWQRRQVSPTLSTTQKGYVQQLARMGCIVATKFVQQQATGSQLRAPVVGLAKTNNDVFTERYGKPQAEPESSEENPPARTPPRRVTFAEPVAESRAVCEDGDPEDQEIDVRPGSPIDVDESLAGASGFGDPQPNKIRTREERMQENPFYDSESDDSPGSAATTQASTGTNDPSEDWGASAKRRPRGRRQVRRPGECSIPYPRGFDLKTEQHLRSAINRERAEYRVQHPQEFRSEFLGSECCHLCGETPRHDSEAECAVYYYRTIGRLPQQCTLPCLYCESPKHTTDACPFLHVRCSRCSFRGHMHFECKRRRTVEWLIAYLDCCHLGKLTRENPDGPLRGRWGFGDVSRMQLPADVWELIRFKERSLKHFRKKIMYGNPGFNPIREAGLNWALILQRNEQLDKRERDLDRAQRRMEEREARWRAERSAHRHEMEEFQSKRSRHYE